MTTEAFEWESWPCSLQYYLSMIQSYFLWLTNDNRAWEFASIYHLFDFQRPNMRVHPDQTPYPANLRPSVLCPPCIIRTPSSESLELTARTCWGYAINASTSGLTPRLETGNSSVSGSPAEETPSERSLSSLDWSPVDLGPYECGLLRLRQRSRNEAVLPRTLENRGLASGQHTGRQAQMMHTPAAVES